MDKTWAILCETFLAQKRIALDFEKRMDNLYFCAIDVHLKLMSKWKKLFCAYQSLLSDLFSY